MEDRGPFDRILQSEPLQQRDRTATFVVVLGVVLGAILLVLVLPPISIFDDGGGSSGVNGQIAVSLRDELPAPPAGYEAVSALYDLTSTEPIGPGARPRVTVNLSTRVSEGAPLVLFTYRDESWQRLADAVAVAGGDAAQAELTVLPPNVAAFRAVERVRTVVGRLAAGDGIDARSLDALTTLNVTGFAPAADGGLSGGPLQLPDEIDVAVAPTIGATTTAQVRNLNAILGSSGLRDAHVQALVQLADDGNYAGIDLDYRTVDAANEEEFVVFVKDLSDALHGAGRTLSLTLPLPVLRDDGWDMVGYDWDALAPLADTIKLPLEPEQDRYYERMDAVLGFLTSRIGSSKLLLSVSTLSHERGTDGVRDLTLTEALALASTAVTDPEGAVAPGASVKAVAQNLASETGGSALRWDDVARAVAFGYTGGGGSRVVWLSNVFSESFKVELAERYRLGGIAIDNVSQRTADANIWPAVQRYAQGSEANLVKPNGGLLEPRWTVSGGQLEAASGASVTWVAPDEDGTYTVTLVVSDGVLQIGQELRVPVRAAAGSSANAP